MHIANLYRKLQHILDNSNIALANKGLNKVNTLYDIIREIQKLGTINKLSYLLNKETIVVSAEDFGNATTIYNNIFSDNKNLQDITIPSGVTIIYGDAFDGCSNLKNIYLQSAQPAYLTQRMYLNNSCIVHVPVGSGDIYKSYTNWAALANHIVEYAIE